MAATVLRVKRRLEENPQDALVLVCKRIKTDKEEISPSVFVFRGTVENEENPQITNLPKSNIKLKVVSNVNDIIQRMRKVRKAASTQSRYEIVNCRRGIKDDTSEESDNILNVIDMQKTNTAEGDAQYAYDLYTALKEEFDISMIDNFVGVETDLFFDYEPVASDNDIDADDDDDSNDENNWRNDYPDSEASSINEEDMIEAMKNTRIEDELSSDAGEENYTGNLEPVLEDVNSYGEAYAYYRAKVRQEYPDLFTNKSLIQPSLVQEEQGYKDDSDDGFYYGAEEDTPQFIEQYADEHVSDDNGSDNNGSD